MTASVEARSGSWILPWARFSSSFFLEGAVLIASVGARSGSWMSLTRLGNSFFLEGPRLDNELQWGPLQLSPGSALDICRAS